MSLNLHTTNRRRPWWQVGHRVLGNPLSPVGTAYCLRCKEWGASKSESRYEGRIYACKEWCARCGAVIAHSIWDGSYGHESHLLARATDWATSPEDAPDEVHVRPPEHEGEAR